MLSDKELSSCCGMGVCIGFVLGVMQWCVYVCRGGFSMGVSSAVDYVVVVWVCRFV